MKSITTTIAAMTLCFLFAAAPVSAHLSNPDFSSRIDPLPDEGATAGVSVSIPPGSDHVRLQNGSGEMVLVLGVDGEPYLRFLENGEVEVNVASSTYKRTEGIDAEDREQAVKARPDSASEEEPHEHPPGTEPHSDVSVAETETEAAASSAGNPDSSGGPDWRAVRDAEPNTYEWRDTRVRYLGQGVPPQVSDESEETLIKEYAIPLEIAGVPYDAQGTLIWKGEEQSSSTLPFIGVGALFVLAVGGAVLIRRRRGAEGG